jgi:hypothetical protein
VVKGVNVDGRTGKNAQKKEGPGFKSHMQQKISSTRGNSVAFGWGRKSEANPSSSLFKKKGLAAFFVLGFTIEDTFNMKTRLFFGGHLRGCRKASNLCLAKINQCQATRVVKLSKVSSPKEPHVGRSLGTPGFESHSVRQFLLPKEQKHPKKKECSSGSLVSGVV